MRCSIFKLRGSGFEVHLGCKKQGQFYLWHECLLAKSNCEKSVLKVQDSWNEVNMAALKMTPADNLNLPLACKIGWQSRLSIAMAFPRNNRTDLNLTTLTDNHCLNISNVTH